jgi:L-alanine-DL-glutamate epimerase-like enolase superfamily enzyme
MHVHLLAAVPNAFMVEYVPRSAAILRTMPILEDGYLVAPKAPGLGLELDEAVTRRYRVG